MQQRAQILRQAEQTLLDDSAIAPIFFGVTRDLVSPQVKGWISNNINTNRTRYLSWTAASPRREAQALDRTRAIRYFSPHATP